MISSAVIMFIIANAGLFSFLITRAGVPAPIGEWLVQTIADERRLFLLAVNAFLFVHRHVHRDLGGDHRAGADPGAGRQPFRHRPGAFRHGHGRQPGAGHDHAALRRQPVRRLQVARIPLDRIVAPLVPFVLVILTCLMIVTYVPEVSLLFRDLLY